MPTSEMIDGINSDEWETLVVWIQVNPLAYKLIMCIETGTLFRRALNLDIPDGFIQVREIFNKPVYDSNGLLLAKYGALERYWKSRKEHMAWLHGRKRNERRKML